MSSAAIPHYVLKVEKHDFRGEVLVTLLVDLRTEKNNLNGAGATEAPNQDQLRL